MNYTTKVTVRYWRISDSFWWNSLQGAKGKPKENWMYAAIRHNHFQNNFAPKGGKTEVTIQVFDENNDPVTKFVGIAYCSMKDNFCYKLGREIAFGRAMKQLEQWRDANVVYSVHDND